MGVLLVIVLGGGMKMKKKFVFLIITFILGFSLASCSATMGPKMKLSKVSGGVNPNFQELDVDLNYDTDYIDYLKTFSINSTKAVLTDTTKNSLFSPISYYMTLAMLLEMTNDTCFDEILAALNMPDISYVRHNSKTLFTKHFEIVSDKERIFMGNSLWIDNEFTVKNTLLENLAKYYYATSYNGDLQSSETAKKMKAWIDSATDNLIKSKYQDYIQPEEMVLILINTLLLKAKWINNLIPDGKKDFFNDNSQVKADFYRDANGLAHVDEDYISYFKYYTNGYYMSFVLPNESNKVDSLIEDPLTLTKIMSGKKDLGLVDARAYIPKFGFPYEVNLVGPSKSLGINEIFNELNQGFKKVNDDVNIFVSLYKQKSYLEIDEFGVKAAAVTIVGAKATSANPNDPITVVFNRPFVFVVFDQQHIPLFVGVLNSPN